MADVVAVVLAAGVGSRLGEELPKQFLDLNGVPVLTRTVAGLAWCRRVVVVHHAAHADRTREVVAAACDADRLTFVEGGSTRRQSISAALGALSALSDTTAVVLQNAASPNTPRELVEQCLAALEHHEVAQAYLPAVHTVVQHEHGELQRVLQRSTLGYTADPTAYRLKALRRIAHAQSADASHGEMTLDTARVLGIAVRLVASPSSNLKLTTWNDLIALRAVTSGPQG